MRGIITAPALIATLVTIACREAPTSPKAPPVITSVATDRSTGDTPNYNLEILLRPAGSWDGFGHVKFRQSGKDDVQRIDLGVWVRDLAPNTEYLLQRATDMNLNGSCTGVNWLILGKGPVPQSILTDEKGTGREDLFRIVPNPAGSTFDIYFRIVRKDAPTVPVLISDCYQFTIR